MKALRDIYFYNAHALASELRAGTISETRAIKHLVASVILGGIGFEVPITGEFCSEGTGGSGVLSVIIVFVVAGVISYYGIWLAQQVNTKGDGKDFFLRFSVLALPIGVQLMVLFVLLGVVLISISMFMTSSLGTWGIPLSQVLFILLFLVFVVMFFLRMRKYIGLASGAYE